MNRTFYYQKCLQVLSAAWVKGIAQPIAQQVNGQDGEDDEQAWEEPHPPRVLQDERLRLIQHIAPGGRRRLHAQAEEGNISFRENGVSQTECGRNNDGAKCIGHKMAKENA